MRKREFFPFVLFLLFVVAACTKPTGGDPVASAERTAAPSPTATLTTAEQALRYARCLREHGMPMPDPEIHGDSVRLKGYPKDQVPADVARAAEEACKALVPVLSEADQERKLDSALRYSQCMREQGVEAFPDPDPATGRVRPEPAIQEDPQYEQAKMACSEPVRSSP